MSGLAPPGSPVPDLPMPDSLLKERGVQREFGEFVVGVSFSSDDRQVAFALSNGAVWLVPVADKDNWTELAVHDGGAVLSLAPDARPGGFVSGGDDGRFCRIAADGAVTEVAAFGSKWVEKVASHADAAGRKGSGGLLACAVGRSVHLFDAAGGRLKTLDHPSTVTGLAFDAKGKRVAASHYNGATLWFVAAKTDSPRRLEWKGSHTGIAIHPEGEAVVTTMQENALHGWRLADGQHMRMSGYPAKVETISFSRTGKWLASSGADTVVLWPFFGGGPMGKAPTELAGSGGVLCTAVACHPQQDICAAGFGDGVVVIAEIGSSRLLLAVGSGRGAVTALTWSGDGACLAVGTETGFAALIDCGQR